MDPWVITPVERSEYMEKFKELNPNDGLVPGRLVSKQLSQPGILGLDVAHIWFLVDVNCDNNMDINRFMVSCKLIAMKLEGFEIPSILPPALKDILLGPGQRPRAPLGGVALPGMAPTGNSEPMWVQKQKNENKQKDACGPEMENTPTSRIADQEPKPSHPDFLFGRSNRVSDLDESRENNLQGIKSQGPEEVKIIKSIKVASVSVADDNFEGNEPINRATNHTSGIAEEILRKCSLVEQQVKNNKVKLGVLRKKLILDVIQRCRAAVKGAMSFENEETELDDLIVAYKLDIPNNFDSDTESNQTIVQHTSVDPVSERGHELLRTCDMIEKQIRNGEVKMGMLRKRLCLEIVKRAQDAVMEAKSFQNEEMELNDLIANYKFKT